jgi:streptogramin lyase
MTQGALGVVLALDTAGQFTSYPTAGVVGGVSIADSPNGDLWFVDPLGRALGRITTSGVFTLFPAFPAAPTYIAADAAGAIWFTDPAFGRLWRFTLGPGEPQASATIPTLSELALALLALSLAFAGSWLLRRGSL